MSYEPTIIVEKKDLMKIESKLQRLADLESNRAAKYLSEIIKVNTCKFKNMEFYIFQPEFTSFNREVRSLLQKYNIEYGEDYRIWRR